MARVARNHIQRGQLRFHDCCVKPNAVSCLCIAAVQSFFAKNLNGVRQCCALGIKAQKALHGQASAKHPINMRSPPGPKSRGHLLVKLFCAIVIPVTQATRVPEVRVPADDVAAGRGQRLDQDFWRPKKHVRRAKWGSGPSTDPHRAVRKRTLRRAYRKPAQELRPKPLHSRTSELQRDSVSSRAPRLLSFTPTMLVGLITTVSCLGLMTRGLITMCPLSQKPAGALQLSGLRQRLRACARRPNMQAYSS